MNAHPALVSEIIPIAAHRRSRRRLLFGLIAAAIGGAGGGATALALVFTADAAAPTPTVTPLLAAEAANFERNAAAAEQPTIAAPRLAEPTRIGKATAILMADSPRLIIQSNAPEAWIKSGVASPIERGDDEIFYALEKEVHIHKLPSELRMLIGQPVSLYDEDGDQCDATVGDFSALRLVYADFDGRPGDPDDPMWDAGEPALVADLEGMNGTCPLTLVGAVIGAPGIAGAAKAELSPGDLLTARATQAWKQTDGWKQAQERFIKQGGKGKWDAEVAPSVVLVGAANSGVVVVTSEIGGCGDFEATVSAIYRVESGSLGARLPIPAETSINVQGAAYANGDDLPEIFFSGSWGSRGVLLSGEDGYDIVIGDEVSWHHCPC